MLDVKNLTVKFGAFTAVDDLSFSVGAGQWLMLVGPNGAGKSSVLSAIAQTDAYTGSITFQGEDLHGMKPSLRAQRIGILAQNHYVGYAFSVEEVVRLGCYSKRKGFLTEKNPSSEDAVEHALKLTGMDAQRSQSVLSLSGGELQRTFLAQVLAQDPQLLLLDEPTNHLDLIYQKQIFTMINEWLKEPGRAVISVVHDLSLAKQSGTHALLMDHGKKVAYGTAAEVMTPEHLNAVYGMDVGQWMRSLLSLW